MKKITKRKIQRAVFETMEDRTLFSVFVVSASASGSGTGTEVSPMTISQAEAAALPGDTVQLLDGTYNTTLMPANSGTSGAPITFEAAPGNNNVVISGTTKIDPTSWTQDSGNIYKTQIDLGDSIDQQVFVDGHMINLAQYPNVPSTPGQDPNLETRSRYATVGKVTVAGNTVTLGIKGFNPTGLDMTNAHILLVGGIGSTSSGGTVVAAGNGFVTYSGGTGFSQLKPKKGNHVIIFGAKGLLDSNGEYYYDPTTKTLYAQMPDGSNPANHTVEVKTRNAAIDLSGVSFVDVKNIGIFGATALTDGNSTNDIFDGVNAKYVSNFEVLGPNQEYDANRFNSGIFLDGSNNAFINGMINFSAGNGVTLMGDHNTVANNTIENADYVGSYDAGVLIGGSNQTVAFNNIFDVGRDGVQLVGENGVLANSRIAGNHIFNFDEINRDGGGIYGLGIDGTGTRIDHNLINNNLAETSGGGGGFKGAGIYADGSLTNAMIDHNVIFNGGDGAIWINANKNDSNGSVAGDGDIHGLQIFNNTISSTGDRRGLMINMVRKGTINGSGVLIANNLLGPGYAVTGGKFSTAPTVEQPKIKGKVKFVDQNNGNFTTTVPFNNGFNIPGFMDVPNGTGVGAFEPGVMFTFGVQSSAFVVGEEIKFGS